MNVGFVSVRFGGLDGVSLESAKLADVLRSAGHEISWFAGELGADFSPGSQHPLARFDSSENLELQSECFGVEETPDALLDVIEQRAAILEAELRDFIALFDVEVLVPQNSSSIPMQLPLGVAIARLAHGGMPVVAHHHDFAWERERFYPNGVPQLLEYAFPPVAPHVKHMVINSLAQQALAERTGANSVVLPNVMDFEHPPPVGDGAAFRRYAGLEQDDVVLLQATRIIPRKSIELTLELAGKLASPAVKVVITHPSLDEGSEYADFLTARAAELGVDYRVAAAGGPNQPSLADAYAACDLVTYPSRIEGFGNALLEAIYYRCPVLINRYPVYLADIAPAGLDLIEIDGELTDGAIAAVERILGDSELRSRVVADNYEICVEHYSYAAIRRQALPLFEK